MPRLEETITIARSIEDCWRYVSDFSTIEQWDPGVYRARKVTAGPVKQGTEFEVIITSGGRQKMIYTVDDLEAPHRITLTGRAKGLTALDTIEFQAIDSTTTEVHYIADLRFGGILSVITPLMKPWLDRIGTKAVQGMKQALEPWDRIDTPSPLDKLKRLAVVPAAWEFTERGYLKMDHKGLSEFMDGKTVAITGPTSGLGLATACEIARLGAHLILIGRDRNRLAHAVQTITDFSGYSSQTIDIAVGDLSRIDQIRQAADQVEELTNQLDVLINNAGALFEERRETPDGLERSVAINLVAPYLLTKRLLNAGLLSSEGRVINVSSGGIYTQPLVVDDMNYRHGTYDGPKAYARAKRGLVALTDHWASTYDPEQTTFNSMHPGWADTPGVARSLPRFHSTLEGKLRDSRMGADTIVWLASASAVEHTTGEFFFDRKPRPTEIFGGTAVSPEQTQKLLRWLDESTNHSSGSPSRV